MQRKSTFSKRAEERAQLGASAPKAKESAPKKLGASKPKKTK